MEKYIEFTKMEGLGNDYIYVNADKYQISNPEELAIRWSRYHTGVGSDGLVLISRSDVADFRMRMFNNDGSEGKMCGNASRCIAKYVYERGLTDKTEVTLETLAGIKTLRMSVNDGIVEKVTVDMGEPVLACREQVATETGSMDAATVEACGRTWQGTFVSMGNPHYVNFVDDVEGLDIAVVGPVIEHDPLFPERINVEFVQKISDDEVRMRVWERGSGITQACGTGACATAVAAAVTGRTGRTVKVVMDGGVLEIAYNENDGHVYMTGPAAFVFDGKISL